uniref:Uncharacterized protein n=1 Tax=Salmonella sp. TaxID=599 RepID=A0A482ET46_SALSP|nr:hypothetical protein [Salmonella sp.]QBM91343.1 hypothetical protein NNIBIDOC_00010 [Salmonella sp.]
MMFLILRIAANNVPVGSILEWNEEMVNGEARRWWCTVFFLATQHVGSLYYRIPAVNFDTTPKKRSDRMTSTKPSRREQVNGKPHAQENRRPWALKTWITRLRR